MGEGKGGHPHHPELGPNKFQERPSGASRMQEKPFSGIDPLWLMGRR